MYDQIKLAVGISGWFWWGDILCGFLFVSFCLGFVVFCFLSWSYGFQMCGINSSLASFDDVLWLKAWDFKDAYYVQQKGLEGTADELKTLMFRAQN